MAMKSILDFLVARWALFFLAASVFILAGAYFFQYGLGYQPCELCLYQRYPYMLVIVAAGLAYLLRHKVDISSKRAARGFLVIIIILLFLDAFLAAHHIGVEQGYWQAFTACTGIEIDPNASPEDIFASLPEASIPCDQRRTIPLIGLSFAEANLIYAALLGVFGIYTYRRTR